MTLSDAANIGQVFAALGVILSLIFIGWQVRQNTKSLRSSTLQRNTDLWFSWFALVADPRFAVVYAKGSSGRDLDQTEFSQFLFRWALEAGLVTLNPTEGIKNPPGPKSGGFRP